jgi:hypothetical protein
MYCFLSGTDKPVEFSRALIKDRTMDNVQNCDSYITITGLTPEADHSPPSSAVVKND